MVECAGDALTVIESRPADTAWLLDGLWRQLGVDTALAKVLGGRRFTTDVERVLFAMVANRAIDPLSKLATAKWACNDVAVAGLESMDEDQAYRAMDLLVAADAQAEKCPSMSHETPPGLWEKNQGSVSLGSPPGAATISSRRITLREVKWGSPIVSGITSATVSSFRLERSMTPKGACGRRGPESAPARGSNGSCRLEQW